LLCALVSAENDAFEICGIARNANCESHMCPYHRSARDDLVEQLKCFCGAALGRLLARLGREPAGTCPLLVELTWGCFRRSRILTLSVHSPIDFVVLYNAVFDAPTMWYVWPPT